MVLGQVSQINRHDIALSLPNNLTGFVPLTEISEKFTEYVESLMAEDEDEEGISEAKDVELKSYFYLGQYLRAYVVSTIEDTASGSKGKRHIELSINPRQVNSGLKKVDLVAGSMVQASVASVEDHGLVMNLGLEDAAIRGFMSSKQIGRDIASIKEGTVFLCLVPKQNSKGNVFNLQADPQTTGDIKKHNFLSDAPSVDSYLPGTAVEILILDVTPSGITGKAMGLLDVTADFIHSGAAASGKELTKKYTSGSKVKGRIICTFPTSDERKIGMSLLDHVISLRPKAATSGEEKTELQPLQLLPLSKVVTEAKVVKVDPRLGLFLDVGVKGVRGFAHVSKIADKKIDALAESTGAYKLGSIHKARVIGFNAMDGLFIMSMEEKVLNQPFLRVEDVEVGQIVEGTIEKLIVDATGLSGLIVRIADGISGLVPDTHFADIRLQHPEKKFKEGGKVTARVLSTNLDKRQIRLTLKKTLVNSESDVWKSYGDLAPGMQAPGTIINILSSGAVVQFYGAVKAFLPVSEMSESYIEDPKQHFRNGQVVTVHIISIDPSESRMIVSCKDPTAFTTAQQEALRNLQPGQTVSGTVSEKTSDEIMLELEGSRLKALLHMEHLVDGSAQKSLSAFKRIRVGQVMKDLLLLSKQEAKYLVKLSSKPSLVKCAKEVTLLKSVEDVVEGSEVHGFVKNISPSAVFVQFGNELTGLLPKSHLSDDLVIMQDFGLRRHESITSRILSVDFQKQRFSLTKKPIDKTIPSKPTTADQAPTASATLSNPVDKSSQTLEDFSFGKLTKAKVSSVKDTQLNVELADGVQGRIDVSEVFDDWADINNKKHPLSAFHKHDILPVRILGMHDSRNHRFLPITHRDKAPVFELTAKPKLQNESHLDVLTLDKVQADTEYLVYVNNVADDFVWVNLSPNVRGRIKAIDVSDNIARVGDLKKNFPVGCAIKAKVTNVNVENNRLDLSARTGSGTLTFSDVKAGILLPGRVTKVTERQVIVQLSDVVLGSVHIIDLADDYSTADPTVYHKNQTVRVCVKSVDAPNKRIALSTRPSKVLSSSSPVRDLDVSSISQLKVNDVYRGFVKNVADNGVFVSLASNVTAYIRITDLSDSYLKDWKAGFEIDQLVEGKIIAVDVALNHVQMSLRESHMKNEYKPPLTFADLEAGQAVPGKIKAVAEYGVFVAIDNSANISGLCHRSQLSDQPGANPMKLFEEGDAVKAMILKVDLNSRKVSFGLKASYFANDEDDEDEDEDEDEVMKPADSGDEEEFSGISDGDSDDELNREKVHDDLHEQDDRNDSDSISDGVANGGVKVGQDKADGQTSAAEFSGLSVGFDWTGNTMLNEDKAAVLSETESEIGVPKKKKRRKAEIKIDRTGDLDANGPQSVADFERLLLGQPHSSMLWVSYMAFQLELGEVEKAREVAERALKTINIREQEEKLNVWVALLNLENTYGNEESLEEIFKRACQYNDSQDMHERLISIYIQSGNNEVRCSLGKHELFMDVRLTPF